MKDLLQSKFILITILFYFFGGNNGSLDEVCQSGENHCNIQFSFTTCILILSSALKHLVIKLVLYHTMAKLV